MTPFVFIGPETFYPAAHNAGIAWKFAEAGNYDQAMHAYNLADTLLPDGKFDAGLSVLRHMQGRGDGVVMPVKPTEDMVVGFTFKPEVPQEKTDEGLEIPPIDVDQIAESIRHFLEVFDPGIHRANIAKDLPHVLVMSTGRCGTTSLCRLLERSNVMPYHTYWWHVSLTKRLEAMARFLTGRLDDLSCMTAWLETRSAEWLGAISEGKTFVGLNHWDTVFAPAFAAVHPRAKFVYLRRDPSAVFKSFFGKDQWLGNQLQPIACSFEPFRWRQTRHSLPELLAWYVQFTEAFAEAMIQALPYRVYYMRAEDMFAEHAGGLLDFIGADVELNGHFRTKINEKAHKAAYSNGGLVAPKKVFLDALERVRETGRL